MSAAFGAAAGDVLWSLGFLVRHAWVILPLSAIPAAQRIFAAMHPDDPGVYAWPLETLVAVLRLATMVVVFWLGWRADASVHRAGLGSVRGVLGALGDYVRQDWARLVVAALIATIVLVVLNLLGGPILDMVVRWFSADTRIAGAWAFGVRNLLVIPLFYAFAYGLVRPAFVAPGP